VAIGIAAAGTGVVLLAVVQLDTRARLIAEAQRPGVLFIAGSLAISGILVAVGLIPIE
jgi:hypothetical protein